MQEEDEAKPGASPTSRHDGGASTGWRPDRGLRPVGGLLPQFTRPVFRKRSPAGAHLMTDWVEIVGPALAAQSMPQKLSAGTLTLRCSGPMAMELQHLAPLLISKINSRFGQALVQRLRFVQGVVTPPAPRRRAPAPVAVPPRVSTALEGVADPELRAALERLARGVYRGKAGG
ncbi:DUF721 domain-containing protein [Pseudoroseomonas globiformis]|uniref:DUF721 domain-containing protein n=1 Tax=Teichococcus globiformis TaxID=2307229 RepID=A0ABV7FXX8_9PROT